MTREPASASDPARGGRGLVAAMTDLFLQPTGSPTQYEVIADAQIVGRITLSSSLRHHSKPWVWSIALAFSDGHDPVHGFEATRDEAMHAFASRSLTLSSSVKFFVPSPRSLYGARTFSRVQNGLHYFPPHSVELAKWLRDKGGGKPAADPADSPCNEWKQFHPASPRRPQPAPGAHQPFAYCCSSLLIDHCKTISLPSQKSLLVVGSIPIRAMPSCEIGRTPDGQFGGGSIVEYVNDRISSQVFVMGLPFRLQRKASKEQRLLSGCVRRYCPLSSLINLPMSKSLHTCFSFARPQS